MWYKDYIHYNWMNLKYNFLFIIVIDVFCFTIKDKKTFRYSLNRWTTHVLEFWNLNLKENKVKWQKITNLTCFLFSSIDYKGSFVRKMICVPPFLTTLSHTHIMFLSSLFLFFSSLFLTNIIVTKIVIK